MFKHFKEMFKDFKKIFCFIYIYQTIFIQSYLQCIQDIILISMCVPWELNPQPFVLLTQCSTTEPQEHYALWAEQNLFEHIYYNNLLLIKNMFLHLYSNIALHTMPGLNALGLNVWLAKKNVILAFFNQIVKFGIYFLKVESSFVPLKKLKIFSILHW